MRVNVQNTYSAECDTDQGIHHGSVMLCTIFAVVIDGCLSNLLDGVESTLNVNDLMIYYTSEHQNTIERVLQNAIEKFKKWCGETGFNFSAAKNCGYAYLPKERLS